MTNTDTATRKRWFIGLMFTGYATTLASFMTFIDFFSAVHAFAPGDLGNPEGLVQPFLLAAGLTFLGTNMSWVVLVGYAVPLFRAGKSSPGMTRRHSISTLIIACLASAYLVAIIATWMTLDAIAGGNTWFNEQFWVTGWPLLVPPFSTATAGLACIITAWFTARAQVQATRTLDLETCQVCGREIDAGFFTTTITCLACGRAACTRCMSPVSRLCTTDHGRLAPEQKVSVGRLVSVIKISYCLVAVFGTIGGNLLSSYLFPTNDLARYSSWILLGVVALVACFLIVKITRRKIKMIAGNLP